jgi:hypothetical protein
MGENQLHDSRVFKILLERERDPIQEDCDEINEVGRKRRRSGEYRSEKRRKYESMDRCVVTKQMLECAVKRNKWEIVAYLRSKGTLFILRVRCLGPH